MKYYRDADNNYLGGWDENPPNGAIEVPAAPDHARQKWGGSGWLPLVLTQKEEDLESIRNDVAIDDLLSKRPDEIEDQFGQTNNLPALAEKVAILAKQLKLLSNK